MPPDRNAPSGTSLIEPQADGFAQQVVELLEILLLARGGRRRR